MNESINELILRGHFSKLRDDINRKNEDAGISSPEVEAVIEKAYTYLKKLKNGNKLDEEGQQVYLQLETILQPGKTDELNIRAKLPMKKAQRNKQQDRNKKTGT